MRVNAAEATGMGWKLLHLSGYRGIVNDSNGLQLAGPLRIRSKRNAECLAEVYGDVRYIPLIEGLKEPYSVCKSKVGGSCVQQR
jgi:hypothetical protein